MALRATSSSNTKRYTIKLAKYMDDRIGKEKPNVQANNQSIAIGEINISGTVTGNITIGHTIVQPAGAFHRDGEVKKV